MIKTYIDWNYYSPSKYTTLYAKYLIIDGISVLIGIENFNSNWFQKILNKISKRKVEYRFAYHHIYNDGRSWYDGYGEFIEFTTFYRQNYICTFNDLEVGKTTINKAIERYNKLQIFK